MTNKEQLQRYTNILQEVVTQDYSETQSMALYGAYLFCYRSMLATLQENVNLPSSNDQSLALWSAVWSGLIPATFEWQKFSRLYHSIDKVYATGDAAIKEVTKVIKDELLPALGILLAAVN